MAATRNQANRRILHAVALALLVAAPALAGCMTSILQRDPTGVRTTCDGVQTSLNAVPHPASFERRDPASQVTPPFQGVVRIVLLLPAVADATLLRGARLAASELAAAGAPVNLVEITVNRTGVDAGRFAMEAAISRSPSVVVSALDNATTEGMVHLAVSRRIPLLAAETTTLSFTAAQETSGFVYRVPPPRASEGRALADLVWSSGCRSATVIRGTSVEAEDVERTFRRAYEARGGTFGRVVPMAGEGNEKIAITSAEFLTTKTGRNDPRPEAVVVIASPTEAAALLREAHDRHVSARSVFFFSETAKGQGLVDDAGRDANDQLLALGLRGTSRMRADSPATEPFQRGYFLAYGADATNASAHAYDAVYAGVLAATCARSPEPAKVAAKLPVVWNADAGDTPVSGAEPVVALTASANCAVDYVGASHDYDWNRQGDPSSARFFVWTVAGDGRIRATVPRVEPSGITAADAARS